MGSARSIFAFLSVRTVEGEGFGRFSLADLADDYDGVLITKDDPGAIGFTSMHACINALLCAMKSFKKDGLPSFGIALGESSSDALAKCAALSNAEALSLEAHGGQVLMTLGAREVASGVATGGISFKPLGMVLLEGGLNPQDVVQLDVPGYQQDFPPLPGSGDIRSNILRPPAGFVGREKEMREVLDALAAKGTVTVVGPGGIGKTTLCRYVSYTATEKYLGGGWWIDLSSVHPEADIAAAICGDLRLKPLPEATSLETLKSHLKEHETLLALDGCEDHADAVCELCEELLAIAGTGILITTREELGFEGETTYKLQPLQFAPEGASVDAIEKSEAIQLFWRNRELPADSEVLFQVADICRRFAGFPLAIDLASARFHELSLSTPLREVSAKLNAEFEACDEELGKTSARDAVDEAISWSYGGLNDVQAKTLVRTGVLEGSWRLDLLLDLCEETGLKRRAAENAAKLLMERGLISAEAGVKGRHRVLTPIRDYLPTVSEDDAVELRNAYARCVKRQLDLLWQDQARHKSLVLDLVGREQVHLVAALEHAREHDLDVATALAQQAYDYFLARGPFDLGYDLLVRTARAFEGSGSTSATPALINAGVLAGYAGQFGTAIDLLEEAAQKAEASGDVATQRRALGNLSIQYRNTQALEKAEKVLLKVNALFEGQLTVPAARNQVRYAACLQELGRWEDLEVELDKAADLVKQTSDRASSSALMSTYARRALHLNDTASAINYFQEAARQTREVGNVQGFLHAVEDLAGIALRMGQTSKAARLLGASETRTLAAKIGRPADLREDFSQSLIEVWEALGAEAAQAEFNVGAVWTIEELMGCINSL